MSVWAHPGLGAISAGAPAHSLGMSRRPAKDRAHFRHCLRQLTRARSERASEIASAIPVTGSNGVTAGSASEAMPAETLSRRAATCSSIRSARPAMSMTASTASAAALTTSSPIPLSAQGTSAAVARVGGRVSSTCPVHASRHGQHDRVPGAFGGRQIVRRIEMVCLQDAAADVAAGGIGMPAVCVQVNVA
jgi:hypothetical protein